MSSPQTPAAVPRRPSARLISVLLAATVLGALLSVLAVQWCRVNGWADPDQHLAMCYSDFSLLFAERGLADGAFPFVDDVPQDQIMEYPVLIGLVAGAIAALIPGQGVTPERTLAFYDLNHIAVILCWIGLVMVTAFSLSPERRRHALLVALAPGIILTVSINWDMWAVLLGAAALLAWGRRMPVCAGVLIGLGTAMKLYPLLFLGAIIVLCLRTAQWRPLITVIGSAVAGWVAVNLPFMLTQPQQWLTFYEFSSAREPGFSSMWLALAPTGWSGETFSLLSNGIFLLCCLGIAWLGLAAPRRPTTAQLCLLIVGCFVLLGKVYSPQFVIWLIPLVVLAVPRVRVFFIWQAAEVFHWASVWLISAKITSEGTIGAGHYLFEMLYGLGIAAHMGTLIWILALVVKDILHPESPAQDPLAGPVAEHDDALTLSGLPTAGRRAADA
ncbi:glycosyltransferase family 87 protein [Nesterenkonia muleiensis]|uniref:glycosyltransferase family 87 protein n=1 Tax=Nesterenkonia muleiensis TaxID=2282648 RepID=UPI000E75F3EE|nr:glycosyltransferase 87 family protein [Nesterenkonia muleiensis]